MASWHREPAPCEPASNPHHLSPMAELDLSPRDRRRCLIALIGALAVVSTLSSLMWPILSEALRNRGWDETMIGVNAAAQFGGIVVVALLVTRIIPQRGTTPTPQDM